MDLKNYSTGVQHVGIPTNDIGKTVEFYHKLGFETAFKTVNEEANEKVVFLKLGTLVVETYENHAAKMEHGAIDHVALDVRDIEEIYQYINESGLNSTQDTIHFLPFWENGVKFFTIEGPNKEKVEFSQYLLIVSDTVIVNFVYSEMDCNCVAENRVNSNMYFLKNVHVKKFH